MKKRQLILLIICFLLIGLTITSNYMTISYAKERVINEQSIKEEIDSSDNKGEEIIEEVPIEGEETIIEDTMVEEEEETNNYTNIELSIIIISTIILSIALMYLLGTKLCRVPLNVQISTTKRLIYSCVLVVLICSIIPATLVIATDKKILNSYDMLDSANKSMAVIEITETQSASNINETSKEENTSVIQVSNGASYTVDNLNITKEEGKTTDIEGSTYYGLNATFISKEGSSIILSNSNLSNLVEYSSAFFATGLGTNATLEESEFKTSGNNASSIISSDSAEITASNINVVTKGENAHTLSSLDPNSLVSVSDSNLNTKGANSSLLYSNGKIEINNVVGESNSYLSILEGHNSISITDSNLLSTATNYKGEYLSSFFIYNKNSLNASSSYTNAKLDIVNSTIKIDADSSLYDSIPLFYLTNTKANINITNTELLYGSEILINAIANSEYGDINDNGADITFTTTDQELHGEIIVDESSKVRLNLNNSKYEGKINTDNLSSNVDVTFDYDSVWYLTGDSYINTLQITKKDYLRKNVRKYIKSNGYNVYYNSTNNEWLEGKTYNLQGGGKLIPLES